MNIADLTIQGIDLELACTRLDNVVDDIERLKSKLADLLDDTDVELREGSRFRKLISVKSLLNSVGIDAYSARRGVKSALTYQREAFPQPGDVE
jgi:hypothetical protein